MPKIIDYPRASLKSALEVARDVDSLGGSTGIETAAEKSGRSVSGAYKAIVSAAVKYGFITVAKGRLTTTDLFKSHKLAYSPADEQKALRVAFFRVPVFNRIWTQFRGKSIPLEIFEKVLIREYAVSEADASRVAGYFLDGAKAAGVFVDDKLVEDIADSQVSPTEDEEGSDLSSEATKDSAIDEPGRGQSSAVQISANSGGYVVRIYGPGMDSQIALNEEEDLLIVQAMLRKVSRLLSSAQSPKQKPSDGEPSDG